MLEESRGAANREVETATADMRPDLRVPSSGTFGAHEAADDHRQRADQLLDTYSRDGDVRGVIALLKVNCDYAVNRERECSTRMSQSSDCRPEHGVVQLVHCRAANRCDTSSTRHNKCRSTNIAQAVFCGVVLAAVHADDHRCVGVVSRLCRKHVYFVY